MVGPCRASPVHRSPGAAASKRPKAAGADPSGRVLSPSRAKWRWSVRSEGPAPSEVRMIWATWAAVRRGTSRLSASARSNNRFSVTGSPARDSGAKASNPPER